MVFSGQPSDVLVGATIPAVRVSIVDSVGNVVTSARTSITLAISPSDAGVALQGTVTVAAVNGVATFPDLSINKVGPLHGLKATAPGLASVGSAFFAVNAGTPAQVVAGWDDACALTTTGLAYCWGDNSQGELGDTTGAGTVAVSGGHVFASLTAGYYHTCGLTASGQAYCWGDGRLGQLGNGNPPTSNATPVPVAGGLTFTQLTAGYSYTCGLTGSGVAYCWGLNSSGQLGNGTTASSTTPVVVSGGLTFLELGAGYQHACGLASDSMPLCWGDGGSLTPTLVSVGVKLAHLAIAEGFYCGLTGAGQVACWVTDLSSPQSLPGTYVLLAAGARHVCGLTGQGVAYCTGVNSFWQLGHTDTNAIVPVSGGLTFAQLAGGGNHTCARTRDGKVYCWGEADMGQLGEGIGIASWFPERVWGF
jgi:hypothetical protein